VVDVGSLLQTLDDLCGFISDGLRGDGFAVVIRHTSPAGLRKGQIRFYKTNEPPLVGGSLHVSSFRLLLLGGYLKRNPDRFN